MSDVQNWKDLSPAVTAHRGGWPRWAQASRMPSVRLVVAALVVLCGAMSAMAVGEEAENFAPMVFHIPSQPLVSALQSYSRATGVQLLYESGAATGRESSAVDGEFTRDTALRILLADADLVIRYTRANSITLVPASADPDMPPAALFGNADLTLEPLRVRSARDNGDPAQLRAYNGVIQADIQKALRGDAKTRSGVYSAGVKLWIDGPRTVRRAELFRSSGDRERDTTIARVLDGLEVSQAPPASTPQPVTVMITVR